MIKHRIVSWTRRRVNEFHECLFQRYAAFSEREGGRVRRVGHLFQLRRLGLVAGERTALRPGLALYTRRAGRIGRPLRIPGCGRPAGNVLLN